VESVCCIYHKARKFGESSSEESSSDSDSDSECDHAHHRHQHHRSANGNGGAEKERSGEGAQVEELESDEEPNAYERPPGWKKNKGKRRANGEFQSFQLVNPFLTHCSLSEVFHHSWCSGVLQGRYEHEMQVPLDSHLPEGCARRIPNVMPDIGCFSCRK